MCLGRDVHIEKASPQNPRNSEGAFIELADGMIMLAYSKFWGENSDDHANAGIYAIFSRDDGETWSEGRTLLEKNDDDRNIMSISLCRMQDGSIGMFFLRKYADGTCKLNLVRSYDEAVTWTQPKCCIDDPGYYVVNNDRVIRLRNGRLVFPAALHPGNSLTGIDSSGLICFYYSDDDGNTFHRAKGTFKIPFQNVRGGLQEPGLLELNDGRLWCWARCKFGFQFEAFSDDSGETWSNVNPNPYFTSPCSPMSAKRIQEGKVLAVFNPIPRYAGRGNTTYNAGRTPLACAVSDDGAAGFGELKYLEDDPSYGYCYTAIFHKKDYILLSYLYLGDDYGYSGMRGQLDGLKIKKIWVNELLNL